MSELIEIKNDDTGKLVSHVLGIYKGDDTNKDVTLQLRDKGGHTIAAIVLNENSRDKLIAFLGIHKEKQEAPAQAQASDDDVE